LNELKETSLGKWIVLWRDDWLGVFDDLGSALGAGYDKYGLDTPFFCPSDR